MPVRIYDIAKKLGLDSKSVLAKAKELGIAAAKVPSSSLDKITAEYLEQQLAPLAPPPAPMAPVQESVVELISSPPPPPPVPINPGPVYDPEAMRRAAARAHADGFARVFAASSVLPRSAAAQAASRSTMGRAN